MFNAEKLILIFLQHLQCYSSTVLCACIVFLLLLWDFCSSPTT